MRQIGLEVSALEALGLRTMAGAGPGALPIEAVVPANGLTDLDEAPSDAIVVITDEWDGRLSGYQVDVVLRHAAVAPVRALVFNSPRSLTTSAVHLADRAHLLVLTRETGTSSAWQLVVELDRLLRQPEAEVAARVRQAVTAISTAAAAPHVTLDELLDAASAALGGRVRFAQADEVEPGVAVRSAPSNRLVADRSDPAADVVLPLLAAEAARLIERDSGPGRLRSQLVLQLLLADRSHVPDVAAAAVAAGIPIHHTHIGGWLVLRDSGEGGRIAVQQRRWAALTAIEADLWAGPGAAMWHVTPVFDGIAITSTGDAGTAGLYRATRDRLGQLVELLRSPTLTVTAGLGGAASGGEGLRQSVTEARLTAERAARSEPGSVADTDRAGLRRLLADLSSSPLSADLLADILAPLDELPADRAEVAVVTLNAYLDAQGSPTRAAEALHLHPNAVTYRLRWINAALALDLADPDQRFAVHLACRTRLQRMLG